MESYINHINAQLPDKPGDKILYKYKRKILEEMTERANEISSRGLKDRQVINDLVISEYPDLSAEYGDYYKKETASMNRRRNIVFNTIGSIVYLVVLIIAYLAISFATQRWNVTWAIIVDGVLLWNVYLLSLGVAFFAQKKKIFHIFARMFLMGAVIVFGVAVFIFVFVLTDLAHSWIILMFALIAMFMADALFATAHKHRMAIFYWLLYLPVMSVFAFVIVGAANIVEWRYAWMTIPLALMIDAVIILVALAKNKVSNLEVDDTWKEN